MRIRTLAFAILALEMFSPAASLLRADIQTWEIQNPLTFGLGGSLTGSFQYDATTDTYSNIQLQMTPDLAGAWGPADIITPWLPFTESSGPSTLVIGISGFGPDDLGLSFANPLTNAGGTDTITSGFFADVREFITGGGAGDDSSTNTTTITASTTPEPRTAPVLLAAALVLIGARWRRHNRSKQQLTPGAIAECK